MPLRLMVACSYLISKKTTQPVWDALQYQKEEILMPIPFILAGVAIVAGTAGVGAGIYGVGEALEAKDTMEKAQKKHDNNISRYERAQNACTAAMDKLGMLEMEVLRSFEHFSDLIERIQNRPKFEEIDLGDRSLPHYDPQQLKEVSVGAGVLLGSLAGAAAGTAGGMATGGAVTAAVTALGTASTGRAISRLSGEALNKAVLATIGGDYCRRRRRCSSWQHCVGGCCPWHRPDGRRRYICLGRFQSFGKGG